MLGLNDKAFKRLEPDEAKVSSPVLRGRRRRECLLCYPTLVLICFVFCSDVSASQVTIDNTLEQAKTSAKSYKSIVQKSYANAQALIASGNSSKCSIHQNCFGKKKVGFAQDVLQANNQDNRQETTNTALVFISASMPKTAIQALAIEVKKKSVRLIIRGMINNSMRETGEFVKELGYPVDIDPKLFKKFGVSQVPTFVIPITNQGVNYWCKIRGNVTLSYALERATISQSNKSLNSSPEQKEEYH